MFSRIQVEYLLKNYVIFLGGGGEVIKRLHWITGGRGGGLRGPKKDYVIFEWSPIDGQFLHFTSKHKPDSSVVDCSRAF